jgi:hypothetical protein
MGSTEADLAATAEPSTNGALPIRPNADQSKPKAEYPHSRVSLINRFIDEPRPLSVAVIGGGISGIIAGMLLPKKVPGIKLTIYEKNHDLVRIPLLSNQVKAANLLTARGRVGRGWKTSIPE